jgi:dienelactone hydrolase
MNMKRYLSLLFTVVILLTGSIYAGDIPQSVEELWADVDAKSKNLPLDVEILNEEEKDGIVLLTVRFTVGTYKGKVSKLAGYYAYPKGGKNLPALIQTNGGGQIASKGGPTKWAQRGYACFNPNNSGKAWEKGVPNTEWGAIRPGTLGDKRSGSGQLAPGKWTIDDVVSPRNHMWFARMVGARRAITFLQSRPEVNPEMIGIRGHSTGGVMTVYESIDPRIKAAVPSVGGGGGWDSTYEYTIGNLRGSQGADDAQRDLRQKTLGLDAYWSRMKCPIFFLGASNDFNSPTDNIWRSLELVPHKNRNWVLAPHYNHKFNASAGIADLMWFEDHLKNDFEFPAMPEGILMLKTKDNIPQFEVTPDPNSKLAIAAVDIYYSYGRQPMLRFWTDAKAKKVGDHWEGQCPTLKASEPLFIFANVTYKIYYTVKNGEKLKVPELMVTSSFHTATPEMLKAAGVTPTAKRSREIESFAGKLKDWIGFKHHGRKAWSVETRKLNALRWLGPKGGELVFEINGPAKSLFGARVTRRNRGSNAGLDHFYTFITLEKDGWNEVRLKPEQFQNIVAEKLDDWHMVIKLELSDGQSMVKHKKKFLPRAGKKAVAALPTTVSQWKSDYYQSSDDQYTKDRVAGNTMTMKHLLRNMRWEGGNYPDRPDPWTITKD